MKSAVYLAGFAIVAVALLLQCAFAALSLFGLSGMNSAIVHALATFAAWFGHPLPALRLTASPLFYLLMLAGAAFLVLRRLCCFVTTASLYPPLSFTSIAYGIYAFSIISSSLFLFIMLISGDMSDTHANAMSNIILPAAVILPMTVCWVEILSFRLPRGIGN